MKEFIVYSRRVAIQLREKGFKIIRVGVNHKKPEFNVWAFEDTPELRAALTSITGNICSQEFKYKI